jgi:hypothetical protein
MIPKKREPVSEKIMLSHRIERMTVPGKVIRPWRLTAPSPA